MAVKKSETDTGKAMPSQDEKQKNAAKPEAVIDEAAKQIEKLCETREQGDEIGQAYAALDKMYELLGCGDKRIELSAAKEILSLLGVPDSVSEDSKITKLDVEIKIV